MRLLETNFHSQIPLLELYNILLTGSYNKLLYYLSVLPVAEIADIAQEIDIQFWEEWTDIYLYRRSK